MICALVLLIFCVYECTGKIIRVPSGVMHGKSSPVYYDEVLGKSIFEGLAKYDFSTMDFFFGSSLSYLAVN